MELRGIARFRCHDILASVHELRYDLEYPDTRQGSLPAAQVMVAWWLYMRQVHSEFDGSVVVDVQ